MPGHLLDLLQDVEAPAPAVPLERVGRVGHQLQLLQDELRDEQRAVEEPGLADVGDPAVDDDARVEDLVAALRTGRAEERDQPCRLEPLTPAPANQHTEIRQRQHRERMQEGDARLGRVGPEECGDQHPRQCEPERRSEHRAEHVRDRQVAHPPFEGHDQRAQQQAEARVEDDRCVERLKEDRRARHRREEEHAREKKPGHRMTPQRMTGARRRPRRRRGRKTCD